MNWIGDFSKHSMPLKSLCLMLYLITPAPPRAIKILLVSFSSFYSFLCNFYTFLFPRELLLRHTFQDTARAQSVSITVVHMAVPLLRLGWSCFLQPVQVLLLFATTPLPWTACLWDFCRKGDVILPSETPLPSTAFSSLPRPPNKLNKPFPELHPYEYSIWIPKGIWQAKFLIHTHHTKV